MKIHSLFNFNETEFFLLKIEMIQKPVSFEVA